MRYLEQQLSFVDVIPPWPACFFFSHKIRRSATVMSGGLPPSCRDVPGAQLRRRGFDPRSGPHASAAQACPQSEVQRGVVTYAGCGLVCGEVSAKGRRVKPDAVEVLRETVGGGSRTSRLAPPLFAGPSRSAAPLESIEVAKSSSPEHNVSRTAMHYIGSADERDSSGESSDAFVVAKNAKPGECQKCRLIPDCRRMNRLRAASPNDSGVDGWTLSLFVDGWHVFARWFTGYLPPASQDDVHGWFAWIYDVQALLQARCAQKGMGLCVARRTVLRAFISGFNTHLMALEDAWVRMEMREYYDEPPDDSEW